MSWWRPLVILAVPLIVMLVAQLLLSIVAIAVESIAFGRDPMSMEMTPLLMLAGNISLVAMAAASVLLTVLLARTSWRSIVAHGRSFSAGMMLRRLGLFAALVAVGMGAMMLVAPDMAGVSSFAVTGGTVGMLAVVLLTTPLQAAAEEITFRGTVMPAVASWIRGAQRAALIVGLVVSSLLFGLMHFSVDPWLLAYYTLVGVCMALMAIMTGGLESSIAFHVANNVVLMALGALFSDGADGIVMDRSVGIGGPFMLVFMAVDLIALTLVWLLERRRRAVAQQAGA